MKKKKLLIVAASVLCVTGVLAVFGQRLTSRKEAVPNDSYGLYYRDSNGVYLREPRDCGWLGCFGPDLRSEAEQYKKIRFADPKTFQILLEPTRDGSDSGEILARDATHLFYGGEYVPSGDVQTLKVFGSHAKDKNNIYFRGMVINGIDIPSANLLGRDFITDKRGLYVANSVPPRKAALIDASTFQLLTSGSSVKGKDYFAEDKNFYFSSHGGTYAADPKPNTADFKTLGCDYYLFQGRVFYSIYELKGADPASFRVLGKPSGPAGSCNDFYAIDSSHRYEFDYRVSPDDNYRNRQIDLLLATPADRKAMSSRVTYTCIPQLRLGVNFGYQRHDRDPSPAGSIRLQVYQEARLMEGQLLNADGQWQPLPPMYDGPTFIDCNLVHVQGFFDDHQKPWLVRRDPTSISMAVHEGEVPIFAICDSRYSVKLMFTSTALVKELTAALRDSRVTPFGEYEWGAWMLEDKFFIGTEGAPEVWLPLRFRNGPTAHKEGVDFVTIGFRYHADSFECIDVAKCATFAVPASFPVNLK